MERQRKPFTCYFCNKKIENDSEVGHTSVCGNVLIPCPYKCGSYVPRMDLHNHKRECVNRVGRSMVTLTTTTDLVETYDDNVKNREFKDMFNKIQSDLHKVSNRLENFEKRQLNYTLPNDKLEQWRSRDIEKIKYENQLINEWRKMIDFKLNALNQTLNSMEKFHQENEFQWMNLQQKLNHIEKFLINFDSFKDGVVEEQNSSKQSIVDLANKLDEFKDFFFQENANVSTLCNNQQLFLDEIHNTIVDLKRVMDEQRAKHTSVSFDVKTVSQIASEASEKVEIQEREVDSIKKQIEQMRLDFDILENLATKDPTMGTPGRIIWRIADFENKMAKAKSSDILLKSQIFFTDEFGYRIRILLYLNGLKKWKDRYALLAIHVVKGEFDALLRWPCHIEGTITLRDLENPDNPKNFSKYISAKRQSGDEEAEEPQESSSSYIFIPHTVLTNSKYIKDDCIYLDVRIEKKRKSSTETTL